MSITEQDYFGALVVGATPIICISLGMWLSRTVLPFIANVLGV